ncbi:MAG: hypothetical protein H5T47_07240 [Archaeoglobi archaeon]|nr:hypothetical protein [Candidatus Mnemosynella bozhongmuii]
MREVPGLLKEIREKLEEIEKRLKRIEEEFFDKLSEEELKELEEDLKAYREGKLELIDLGEVERLKNSWIGSRKRIEKELLKGKRIV